jgi:hypothetical protein
MSKLSVLGLKYHVLKDVTSFEVVYCQGYCKIKSCKHLKSVSVVEITASCQFCLPYTMNICPYVKLFFSISVNTGDACLNETNSGFVLGERPLSIVPMVNEEGIPY